MAFKLYDSTAFCAKGSPTPAFANLCGVPRWSTLPGTQLFDNITESRFGRLAVTRWNADWYTEGTPRTLGSWVIPSTATGSTEAQCYIYKCIQAGLTGATPPTWNYAIPGNGGSQTVDGSVIWECHLGSDYIEWSDYDYDGTPFCTSMLSRGETYAAPSRYPKAAAFATVTNQVNNVWYVGTPEEPNPPYTIDLENWNAAVGSTPAQIELSVNRYLQTIADLRAAGIRSGLSWYGMPIRNYYQCRPTTDPAAFATLQAFNDNYQPVINALDVVSPSIYFVADYVGPAIPAYDIPWTHDTPYFKDYVDGQVMEAKRLAAAAGGKPVIPMVWMFSDYSGWRARWEALGYKDSSNRVWCAPNYWRWLLDTIYSHGVDGIVIWDSTQIDFTTHIGTVYGDWWTATQEFMADIPGPQTAHPDSDISSTGWIAVPPGSYYAVLDETTPSDTDYCYTISNGNTLEVALSDFANPVSSADAHTLRYRGIGSYTTYLVQGATVIASWYVNDADYVTYERALTADQIALITDYDDLRVRFVSGS